MNPPCIHAASPGSDSKVHALAIGSRVAPTVAAIEATLTNLWHRRRLSAMEERALALCRWSQALLHVFVHQVVVCLLRRPTGETGLQYSTVQ